ncbi:S41 family peptidase [Bowmanella denitrificans]|uniref:S41 family peptidase n=1 Tax=Bowmanella denitrificans TaxID=366582 RepID=UPI000C9B716B|nr:S41 family peptidase [Bowmanella denitrificans]
MRSSPSPLLCASLLLSFCCSATLQAEVSRADNIDSLLQQHHYNPAELAQPAYQAIRQETATLDAQIPDPIEFSRAFNQLWQQGPFSHVRLAKRQQSAEELAAFLDEMNVGGQGAILTWQDNIAILTVNTMMGQDTIRQIDEAYEKLSDAQALVIDLRHNEGGAFAVRPLVAHLLEQPLAAGAFASRQWFLQQQRAPESQDWLTLPAWQGWSIRSFWQDVQKQSLTKVEFQPASPRFDRQVYVLTSRQTASAAELAAAAMAMLPNVTLVGETTAGKMLSQTLFDLDQHAQLFLPIADYFSLNLGRIEGQGVTPDIHTSAENAMADALQLATRH